MKTTLTLLLLLGASPVLRAQDERPKLVYVYDALSGWSYGFSPVMVELFVRYQDQLEFEVISGGMYAGSKARPAIELADSILSSYSMVENRTGAIFGRNFLDGTLKNESVAFNSEKPAIAMAVFRSLLPDKCIFFASALQQAIFREGMNPDQYEDYKVIVDEFDIDPDDFIRRMKEKTFRMAAREDFRMAEEFRIDEFPAALLVKDHKIRVLTRGYIDEAALERRLLEALAE